MLALPVAAAAVETPATASAIPATASAIPVADLVADADRDGRLTAADAAQEDSSSAGAGALVLPNLDDDGQRCAAELKTITAKTFRTAQLAACNDASDAVVNGPDDALDLAPLRVEAWPDAPDDAVATVAPVGTGASYAHLFRRTAEGWVPAGPLDAQALRSGVELGLEATDVVRDVAVWDGRMDVELTVSAGGATARDAVSLRVAPLILVPQTATAQTVFARTAPSRAAIDRQIAKSATVTAWALKLLKGKKSKVPPYLRRWIGKTEEYAAAARRGDSLARADGATFKRLQRDLAKAVRRTPGASLQASPDVDLFVQDTFEPGYASVPGPNGAQTIRLSILAKRLGEEQLSPTSPEGRMASWPYRTLRGPGAGVVEDRSDPARATAGFDATGALEATPRVAGAPLGKLLLGTSGRAASRETRQLLEGQTAQPIIRLDTSWLTVGHVDETVAVVPAGTPRGWAVIVADPRGALDILRRVPSADRATTRIVGTADRLGDGNRARPTANVDEILRGQTARDSAVAAKRIDAQLLTLRRELGLTDQDVIRVPVLFGRAPDSRKLVAWTGNVVNGVALGGPRFLAPMPHGPRHRSRDLFQVATERATKAKGVKVDWIDTWPVPHTRLGEIHCATNALRDLGDGAWWTLGG